MSTIVKNLMDTDIADFSVKYATKLGASYSETRLVSLDGNSFVLKNSIPEISAFGKTCGIGMRIILNGHMGFMSTNNLDKSNIRTEIEKTISMLKRGEKIAVEEELSREESFKVKDIVKQKEKMQDKSADEKLALLTDIDKALVSQKFEVSGRYLTISDVMENKYFVTSEGTEIHQEIPRINVVYLLTVGSGQKSVQRYQTYNGVGGWEILKDWNLIKTLVDESKSLNDNIVNGIKAPKGVIDVIAAPEVVGIAVHESTGHPYEADRIFGREGAQAGESFVTEKMLGEQIGSGIVNVVDDPQLENNGGYYRFDDEGVKARRKFLIKDGKINEFLHNRSTAAKMNLKSNGSARAAEYSVEPIVRMSNTFMLPGKLSEEELIEDVKLGVYMKNFTEWNIDDKRFNQRYIGSEAYLIKNGKICEPVKRPVLEVTTPTFYSSIDGLSKKVGFVGGSCGKGEPMQGIPVTMGGPTIRLRNIKLGG